MFPGGNQVRIPSNLRKPHSGPSRPDRMALNCYWNGSKTVTGLPSPGPWVTSYPSSPAGTDNQIKSDK